MRRLILLAWFSLLPLTAPAQHFQLDGRQFVLRQGDQVIRFERGRWEAGLKGGKSLTWYVFLWHDHWIHETLHGGTCDSGPAIQPDGSLMATGAFSARNGSKPVKYSLTATPSPQGVRVRCELQKSGPLELTNGIWLQAYADRKSFTGRERLWVDPTSASALSSPCHAIGRRVLVELDARRSLALDLGRYAEVNSEGSSGFALRLNLLRGDFEPDRKTVLQYTISFAEMPNEFPGQIHPMRAALGIGRVQPSSDSVPQYQRLELAVDCQATYENPYDPDQVALDAVFIAPSGRESCVPGFFMVGYRRQIQDGCEIMIPEGNGAWHVRFAPLETGGYRWRLKLRDRSGEVQSTEGHFQSVAGPDPGFIRQSKADPHYFAFDDGRGFFAIGHNLETYHTTGQLGDQAMRKFASARENYNRWWMWSQGFGLEWMDRLGWYRQDAAARLDLVLDLARELRLYYMLCMDTHQDFRESGWRLNPFNAERGGPCGEPADWFTSADARALYRKRLRYTVARWGYSPHVLCWEFGNEMEGWPKASDQVKLAWHREMSDYLRAIDPFRHLITTSFWTNTGPEEFWRLPNIDIVQTHCYTNDDGNVAEPVRRYSLHQWQTFAKPHLFGEFGIRSHSTTAEKDPQGWAIHNALWAGLFSFTAGGPMPWWHESYLDKLDLYFHFTALANFADGVPLGAKRFEPLASATPEYLDRHRPPELRDVTIAPRSAWGKAEHNEFVIGPDGSVAGDRVPRQLLHGQGHKDLRNPPTFVVDYPRPGKFVVRVGRVSRSGLLRISVDGQERLNRELPCGPGIGKDAVYQPQWKLWESTYDEDFSVDLPAGRHRVHVDNAGHDWVTVTSYTFTGCQVLDKPNVLVCGMKAPGLALLWVQNRDSCWYNRGRGRVTKVAPFSIDLQELPAGRWQIQWWETWHGRLQKSEEVEARGPSLRLSFPELDADLALKLLAR